MYRQRDAAKRRAPAVGRSAGRLMSKIVESHHEVGGTSEPAGSSLYRPRIGMDFCGQQVVAPVKPCDVLVPSIIYPRE